MAVTPFDPSSIEIIESSIVSSDLGMNPNNDGNVIRLSIPALTEERRVEITKHVHKIIEEGRKKLEIDIGNKKKDLNSQLDKEIAAVEKEIKDLKKTSISSISRIASETSSELMKKIINTEVNKSNVSAVVDEVIKRNMEKRIW